MQLLIYVVTVVRCDGRCFKKIAEPSGTTTIRAQLVG